MAEQQWVCTRGHEQQAGLLLAQYEAEKLPQTLLFHGIKGIGKALFAREFACYLLGGGRAPEQDGLFGDSVAASLQIDEDSQVAARILAGSHADLLWIEPELSGQQQTPIIKVDAARRVAEFFSKTAAEGGRRIVVIDDADAMNHNAANALLKIVEEPPINGLIILISSRPKQLLPTLLSRCRKLAFLAPNHTNFIDIIQNNISLSSSDSLNEIYCLSGGSIGQAMRLHELNLAQSYHVFLDFLSNYPSVSIDKTEKLMQDADRLFKAGGWGAWCELWLTALMRLNLCAAGALSEYSSHEEQTVFANIAGRRAANDWMAVLQASQTLLQQAQRLHLERRQVIQSLSSMALNQMEPAI